MKKKSENFQKKKLYHCPKLKKYKLTKSTLVTAACC